MKDTAIDPDFVARMYTKSRYAKAYGISRPLLDRRIKNGEVETIPIKGTVIILAAAANA